MMAGSFLMSDGIGRSVLGRDTFNSEISVEFEGEGE